MINFYTQSDTLFYIIHKRAVIYVNCPEMKNHLLDIFQARINPNYIPMSRLSMDLKVMPKSQKGHKYVLCIIDKVTIFLITVLIFQARKSTFGACYNKTLYTSLHCYGPGQCVHVLTYELSFFID